MKKSELKQIIKEEIHYVLSEASGEPTVKDLKKFISYSNKELDRTYDGDYKRYITTTLQYLNFLLNIIE